ncbi:hypothetical protein HQN64_15365 [Enterobacteriaceae bacterium BIT-l23]|nr:hypothetical protein [Enterobacteriaceae bacterium BIT-l23]
MISPSNSQALLDKMFSVSELE